MSLYAMEMYRADRAQARVEKLEIELIQAKSSAKYWQERAEKAEATAAHYAEALELVCEKLHQDYAVCWPGSCLAIDCTSCLRQGLLEDSQNA